MNQKNKKYVRKRDTKRRKRRKKGEERLHIPQRPQFWRTRVLLGRQRMPQVTLLYFLRDGERRRWERGRGEGRREREKDGKRERERGKDG